MSNNQSKLKAAGVALSLLSANAVADATQTRTPIAEFKNGFTNEQIRSYRDNYNLPEMLKGEDLAVWFSMRTSEVLPTAVLAPQTKHMPLATSLNPKIGEITAETKQFGTLSLDEFMTHPQSFAASFIVVHKGEVVYETYPGMKPTDNHIWMSTAKPWTSLVIDMLINEGKIDQEKTIGFYMPEFKDTDWADIKIIDILDMTPGMNSEENDATRSDPDSIAIRTFLAEFGMAYKGEHERVPEVLKDAKSVSKPGSKFEYGSPTTQMLVLLAEAVSNQTFSDYVNDNIWSNVGSDGPLQFHLSPGGTAIAHGVISSQLRDLARFGMLYTPSWNKTSTKQVVTPDMIERIRGGVRDKDFYLSGFDGPQFVSRLNDDSMLGNSRQWDAIWSDGDMWKAGLQSQGLYVSPDKDLVIAFYSTNVPDDSLHRFLRPIATSGMFDK
ncbi:serine hydrolase domain-containing protein [Vibrio breoganii]|uniref:serine hydrolase domain-containing protein n=1 Tax=Vibrio breoganii TaxID=553239 RepID=UPI0012FFDCA2|nr:serine hydrolase domain-containing protein [Vibrio breoganii]